MPPLVRRCRPLLGTFVEIAVEPGGEGAIGPAFAVIAHVHAAMSFHEPDSDLARLRAAPAGTAVQVDPETAAVLRLAGQLFQRSSGLFNVGVGRSLVADGLLPCPPGSDPTDHPGNGGDVEVLDDDRVRCRRPTLIDLGGIGKGHAVDLATGVLAAHGVTRALVNAGGDLRALGDPGEPIHLRGPGRTIVGVVELIDGALASSCNADASERRGVPHRDGAGRPLPLPGIVVAAAPSCAVADAMTKVAFADPALAADMLRELGGTLLAPVPDQVVLVAA